ncbi:hypothetical protein [Bradyrhizobium sp.]|uniref:hypothetical protein n=1 Tax=Bradyrhizobium sp. TaxID=376 RepID=UPI002D01D8FA|nr:hypothetical protein [Bradyrhizobium sp.]HMM89204.1 hypothetical protein [Bradyrhizobium sp.]
MFQFLLKTRSKNDFQARSAGRDSATDRIRATSIFRSIEEALEGAKAERIGLEARINDALARSAVTLGCDSDEYLTRDPEDNHFQNLLGTEAADGQRRLNELGATIRHFQFLKAAIVTRFPEFDFGHNASSAKDTSAKESGST